MSFPSTTELGVLALALGFGVIFALSFFTQTQLQARAIRGDSDATLTKRLTMAGFSFTMIAGAVLVAKALVDVVPYTTFIFASFVGALIAFVVRWRSNRTVERDARKNGTRPSP